MKNPEKKRVDQAAKQAIDNELARIKDERAKQRDDFDLAHQRIVLRIQEATRQLTTFEKRSDYLKVEIEKLLPRFAVPGLAWKIVEGMLQKYTLLRAELEINPHRIKTIKNTIAGLQADADAIEAQLKEFDA